jgi:hypothetical protein
MSTGYPQYMFHREQPSSSGQQFTATNGCELEIESGALLEVNSGGLVELESGSTMNVKSGGYISVESGGYIAVEDGGIIALAGGAQVRETVTAHTSLTKALTHTGIASISAATSAIIFTIEAPVAGLTKTIVPLSTKIMYVQPSTGNTIHVGTTGKYQLKVEMLAGGKAEGAAFVLKSLSTIKWTPVSVPSTVNLKLTQTTASA